MSVEAQLRELEHEITLAAAYAPDQYPSWSLRSYETHMADLEHLWRAIRPKLKQDVETAAWIDLTLKKMIAAFGSADRQAGFEAAQALLKASLPALR